MNEHTFSRGTICVERSVNGRVEWLRINPMQYKEWGGCFSVI